MAIIGYNDWDIVISEENRMKKIFSIVTVLLLTIMFSVQAFAHSYLSGSNPTDGEVLTESIQEITLNFEGNIMEGSFLSIKTTNGEEVKVTDIEIGDGYLTSVLSEPLTNNEYIVNWSIISADGHPLEGTYSFTVNTPIGTEPSEEVSEKQPSESNSGKVDQISNEDNVKVDGEVSPEESNSFIFIVLAIAATVLIASLAFVLKRKK